MMNDMKAACIVAAVAMAAPLGASADTLQLDFGNTVQPLFGKNGNLTMTYTNVATGVNATLTSEADFGSGSPDFNGSAKGDARVNLLIGNTAKLRLNLWDATKGSGFDTAYTNGGDFDWTLGFFDIDGFPEFYDSVTLKSEATYTLTQTSKLLVDESILGQITFSGVNGGRVKGQAGIDVLTQEQADVAVLFTVNNLSSIEFEYSVFGTGVETLERNLLIDGGGIVLPPPAPNPVPLPAGGLLLLAGLGVLGAAGRAARTKAN